MAASISSSIIACLKSFNEFIEQIRSDQKAIVKGLVVGAWEDELGRLRMWAANIGAHQTGQSSLDFRLRDASHIREEIIKLLQGLLRRLQEARDVLADEADSDDEEGVDVYFDGEDPKTEIQELQESLATNINCLFQMSMLVRKPAQHDVHVGSKRAELAAFEPFDYNHVMEKYPEADDVLVKRLGSAITRRRQYLKYRERHAIKLKQGICDIDPGDHDFCNIHEGGTMSLDTKSILSDTVATDFQNQNIEFEDNVSDTDFSQTSFAPTLLSGGNVTIPPPPKNSLGGVPFECPYCFYVITVKGTRSWNKHVFRDLQPYVCTALTCTTSAKLYSTRHEWLHHAEIVHPAPKSSKGFATCPLCREEVESGRQFDRHLARHLQELALFILPGGEEDSDGSEDQDAESSSNAESVDLAASHDWSKSPEDLPADPVMAPHEIPDIPLAKQKVEGNKEEKAFLEPGGFDGEDYKKRINPCLKECEERQRLLGPEHPDTLTSMATLARLFYFVKEYQQAALWGRQAMATRKIVLGQDHPDTLESINNLANTCQAKGELTDAEILYQQALNGYQKLLGPDTEMVLSIIFNLASLHNDQGKISEAAEKYKHVLNGYEKVLGPAHERTLITADFLASLYREQGKLAAAEAMYRQALSGYEKTLGPGDVLTTCTADELASLYREQGRLAEAEKLSQWARIERDKALGYEEIPAKLASKGDFALRRRHTQPTNTVTTGLLPIPDPPLSSPFSGGLEPTLDRAIH